MQNDLADCAISHVVVYDLRQAPDLQERQGTDIFAVFHFHVAGMARDPNNPQDTELYSAAHYSHVYHGQRVYNANPNDPTNSAEWRVDYGQNRTRRRRNAPPPPPAETERTPIYRCDANTFWYPGSAANRERADAEEANDQTQSRTQQFGVRLRDQGMIDWMLTYLGDAVLTICRYILDPHNPQLEPGRRNLVLGCRPP